VNGNLVARELEFEEDGFIQKDPFKDARPNHERFTGYRGNEGVYATHHYYRTVGVLRPQSLFHS
jgi:hypothetical protein